MNERVKLHPVNFNKEFIEWQWPLSGIQSIVMEKLAQASARPALLTKSTIMYQAVVYDPPISALPLYVLCEFYLHCWCGSLTPAWRVCAAYPVSSPPAG